MKLLNTILVFVLLVGCERGSFLTYNSDSVFISENEITLLFTVEKHGFKSGFLDHHGGGESWVDWSKTLKVSYPYNLSSNHLDKELFPNTVEIKEDLKHESLVDFYMNSENMVFNKMGVRTKDRKYVLINSEDRIYNTVTGEVHKDLTDSKDYQNFKDTVNLKYQQRYKEKHRYGEVNTIYTLSVHAEYIVIYPQEVSQPDFIDFKTIYFFNVNTSSVGSFRFNVVETEYESFRITDVEYVDGNWICLFGYFEEGEFKSAIWYSKEKIDVLPFEFYGRGSYDLWNINKGFFAELELFTTNQKFEDFELTMFDYNSQKSYVLKLNIKDTLTQK